MTVTLGLTSLIAVITSFSCSLWKLTFNYFSSLTLFIFQRNHFNQSLLPGKVACEPCNHINYCPSGSLHKYLGFSQIFILESYICVSYIAAWQPWPSIIKITWPVVIGGIKLQQFVEDCERQKYVPWCPEVGGHSGGLAWWAASPHWSRRTRSPGSQLRSWGRWWLEVSWPSQLLHLTCQSSSDCQPGELLPPSETETRSLQRCLWWLSCPRTLNSWMMWIPCRATGGETALIHYQPALWCSLRSYFWKTNLEEFLIFSTFALISEERFLLPCFSSPLGLQW